MNRAGFLRTVGGVALALRMADGEAIQRLLSEPVPDHLELHRYGVSQMDGILRDYYLPVVREHLNQHSLLLTEIDGYATARYAEVRIPAGSQCAASPRAH